jgi:hypothetical protein
MSEIEIVVPESRVEPYNLHSLFEAIFTRAYYKDERGKDFVIGIEDYELTRIRQPDIDNEYIVSRYQLSKEPDGRVLFWMNEYLEGVQLDIYTKPEDCVVVMQHDPHQFFVAVSSEEFYEYGVESSQLIFSDLCRSRAIPIR